MNGIKKIDAYENYEFSLDVIKDMIADKLETHPDNITVTYVIEEVDCDPMDRFPGHDEVTKIRVKVKK